MFVCYFYMSIETPIFAKVLEQTRLKNIEFMKTMNYSLIRILFALVIGLVLVLWPNTAASYIVITVGVAFLIPGVISLFGYFGRKKSEDARPQAAGYRYRENCRESAGSPDSRPALPWRRAGRPRPGRCHREGRCRQSFAGYARYARRRPACRRQIRRRQPGQATQAPRAAARAHV